MTNTDELIPLNQAVGTLIPGKHNPSTVWRWVMRGLVGADGQRVRLAVVYVGRTPHTTANAVRSWLDAVTAARLARSQSRLNGPDIATAAELADRGLTGRHR
jgi:ABC-type ATPase with predicted acetyltransferase domain